jgi:phage-related tail fiber protein
VAESVVTNIAKRKIVEARAGLIENLPIIIGMAFGNGAVKGSDVRTPLASDTALQNETWRQAVESAVLQEDGISVLYTATLAKDTLAGDVINEVALYDAEGDLLAIKSFSNKGKDADMEMVFEIMDKF